jgi:hypothetical protein
MTGEPKVGKDWAREAEAFRRRVSRERTTAAGLFAADRWLFPSCRGPDAGDTYTALEATRWVRSHARECEGLSLWHRKTSGRGMVAA